MDSSNENPHDQIPDTVHNPVLFTIQTTESSYPNPPNVVQNLNSNPSIGFNLNASTSYVQEDFLSSTIPKGKRRGRIRNRERNLSALSFNSGPGNVGIYSVASSTVQFNKTQIENSTMLLSKKYGSSSSSDSVTRKTADDMSDEIIVINKDATAEALTALTAGFPADSLTDEEIEYGVVAEVGGIQQVNYILIRNHIMARWREDVSNWITKEMFVNIVPKHCGELLDRAYSYLVSHGYINFGVALAIKEKIIVDHNKPHVIVIGAGLAGLAAARQLMASGFRVTILEGRRRAGGRVYTTKLECKNRSAAVDLGGSVLTGTLGNPLGILARQLSLTLYKVKDRCPLYRVDGTPVDPNLDRRVEDNFNQLLDKLSNVRVSMGEVSQDVSLGAALETFRENFDQEEMNLYNWHVANLEYANASLITRLSLAFWDQDDQYDMGGDHCFLPGGNGRLVHALAENLPIHYEKTVQTIRYGSGGVQISVVGGQVYEGDMVLCTVPLGVLKSGSIKFMPELPQRKLDAIRRLGFGLLNKVALLFPHAFWGPDLDTFGHLSDHPSHRGEFFLFYSYATVAGGPLLLALVAGEAAYRFEAVEPAESVQRVLRILRDIYEPQGIEVPDPIQTVCTRWGGDPLSRGSYSNVAVGASGDDYDILAESVGDGKLFFAGEATNRRYPATMHGALLSGFREAANIAHYARVRTLGLKVEKNPSQNAHTCASLLADLFRQPEVEFGSFAVLFGRKHANSMAILRVTFGGQRKKLDPQYSNKLLFEQLQSHFNQQQEFHIYTLLSRQQAIQLRDVRGGDDGRLNYLEKIGVKLVGRKGLGFSADAVIASIKAERNNRRRESQKSPSAGSAKLEAGSTKQKPFRYGVPRTAKIVRTSNNRSLSPIIANAESKIRTSFNNPESRVLSGNSGSIYPTSVIGVRAVSSNKDLPPPNSRDAADSISNMRGSMPRTLGQDSGITVLFGSNMCSTASSSNSNLAGPNPNAHIVVLDDDTEGSDPQNFPASYAPPAGSQSIGRASSVDGALPFPDLDDQMGLLGEAGGSNNANAVSGDGSVAGPPSSQIGTAAVSSSHSIDPSNMIDGSFQSQNLTGDISDSISCIAANQDNIFEDIMNELLPPSSSNSWRFNGNF